MWSYYASSHKGVCIGFNTINFFDEYAIFPMNYKRRVPGTKISDNDYARMQSQLLTKSDAYIHEDEYRVIIHNRQPRQEPFDKHCIKELILGNKISADNIIKLMSIIKEAELNIDILKVALPQKPQEKLDLKLEPFSNP